MNKQQIWKQVTFDPGECNADGTTHDYVGKAPNGSTRTWNAYIDNAFKLLNGVPYRPDLPDGFKSIHHALADAAIQGWDVLLRLVENCPLEDIETRRRHWVTTLECDLN
jgi:hypothetical protein